MIKVLLKIFDNINKNFDKFIVLIDAGHGGMIDGEYVTPGKRSPVWKDGTQYFEGVGNREIANKLADKLSKIGVKYEFLHHENKDNSLKSRVIKAKEIVEDNADKHVFGISIHSNGFDKESAHGWQVHKYTKCSTKSSELAKIAHEEFLAIFPEETDRGIIANSLYMTRETPCPFVLTENFFHTNERECKEILMDNSEQEKIVELHLRTILKYINKYS